MSSVGNTSAPPLGGEEKIELAIGGMTCASCASRIEKKLNKLDGVTASVNYATEKALVRFTGDIAVADLVAEVEKTGYSATPPAPPAPNQLRAAPKKSTRPAHCGNGC
ncbi:hypothetical protein GCM10029976_031480 [Kribbella albertanoniae]